MAATTNRGDVLEVDQVLSAMGRLPNTSGLGLEEIGVKLAGNGAIVVDEHFESTVPGIFALGDCIGHIELTPVALAEGMAFVETQFKNNPTVMDYTNIPSSVFSQPPVATVGLTEAEARHAGIDVEIFRSKFRPMRHTLSGRDEKTMMKLVVDRSSDRVLARKATVYFWE